MSLSTRKAPEEEDPQSASRAPSSSAAEFRASKKEKPRGSRRRAGRVEADQLSRREERHSSGRRITRMGTWVSAAVCMAVDPITAAVKLP